MLLAKAISDRIMLPTADVTNIRLYTLGHREFITRVIYEVKEWAYIPAKDIDTVLQNVDDLIAWRAAVAHRPTMIIFSGDARVVNDEMSLLTRFVDQSKLCSLADMAMDANHMYSVFADICECVVDSGEGHGA